MMPTDKQLNALMTKAILYLSSRDTTNDKSDVVNYVAMESVI
ncbi:MAG TPA: hypothetical protein O0X73_04720 [Methanocorpusculum sp.]|nr:hypothetical protein [Methanocorpusculum sp.]